MGNKRRKSRNKIRKVATKTPNVQSDTGNGSILYQQISDSNGNPPVNETQHQQSNATNGMSRRRPSYSTSNARSSRDSVQIKGDALMALSKEKSKERNIFRRDSLDFGASVPSQSNTTTFWHNLAVSVSEPDISPDEIIRRSAFMLISLLTIIAGLIWAVMYIELNEMHAALCPVMYVIIMTSSLSILTRRRGTYHAIVRIQLFFILMLPVGVSFAMGGTVKSGAVVLWSFLCPLGAALFCHPDEAKRWFILYTFAMFFSVTAELWNERIRLKLLARSLNVTEVGMLIMNMCGSLTITFFVALNFRTRLDHEYNRSEELLKNMLPESICKRLKEGESNIIDHYDEVSILFADLVGFTKASAELCSNFLIGQFLTDVFSEWDRLCKGRNMEKIKTIGDAFMTVGGLDSFEKSEEDEGNVAVQMVLLGKDMQEALRRVNNEYGMSFKVRIGIHTGPVVAGVIGESKFAFDVWGDAVNTASRMESHGEAGCIHVTDALYSKVKEPLKYLDFKQRDEVEIKGKGAMTTYLLMP